MTTYCFRYGVLVAVVEVTRQYTAMENMSMNDVTCATAMGRKCTYHLCSKTLSVIVFISMFNFLLKCELGCREILYSFLRKALQLLIESLNNLDVKKSIDNNISINKKYLLKGMVRICCWLYLY